LQIMSWAGFVNFKKQNRELLFASSVGQAGRVKIKLGDGLIPISGRKSNVMMKCFKLTTRWFATAMKPNGPAVVVVSITRRRIRAESRFFSHQVVTVPGGYGTCFCSPGTELA